MFMLCLTISLYLIFKFSGLVMVDNIIIMNFANTSKHMIFFMKYHLLKHHSIMVFQERRVDIY